MASSRGPDFASADLCVTPASSDERLTREARIERSLQQAWAGTPQDVTGDVTTDAVAAIEQEVDGWFVRWTVAEQDGNVVVRAVSVEPAGRVTPPGGLTTDVLRALSPARTVARAGPRFHELAGRNEFAGLLVRWARRDTAEELPDRPARLPARRGRPRLSDGLLRQVATAYLEELPAGTGVLRRLGKRLDRPPATMRDWVGIARERGFLTPAAGKGQRGAMPGPRLLESEGSDDE